MAVIAFSYLSSRKNLLIWEYNIKNINQKLDHVSVLYILVLCIPMPQKIANASTKFSSLLENGSESSLLINCNIQLWLI